MHCPVCLSTRTAYFDKGTDFLFATTDETFTLRSCIACGCLFLDPMPDPGQIASFYPSGYWWDPAHAGLLKRLEALYRRIALVDHVSFIARAARAAVPSARARILDVGCGSATVLSLLKQKGFVVMGVDPSAHAAQIAKRDHDIEVAVGTIGEVGLPSDDFNVVVLLHALEHVSNPREVLREARRLLGEGGRLVLQVPNIDSIQFRLFGVRWYGLDVPRHLIDYSRSSVTELLGSCGFEVERMRHFNLRDNAPAMASSLFPSLDPVRRAVRGSQNGGEAALGRWVRHLAYLAVVVLSYPPAILEAALGRGGTLTIQARKL